MDTKTIRGLTLALSTFFVLISDLPLRAAFKGLALPPYAGLGLVRLVQTVGVLALVMRLEKSLDPLGLSGAVALKGAGRGFFWSLVFGLAAGLGLLVLTVSGIDGLALIRTRLPVSLPDRIWFFVAGGLIAPLAEELFFRGLVFGFFRRWGFATALTISTGLFVLVHSFSGFPLVQVVGGLVFAACYEKEKSLWAPIVIHAAGNIALFTLSLI